jgi:hypothetical protein
MYVEERHVSRGNEAIINSHVFVLEDNPVARLLLNWNSRLLGLGEQLLHKGSSSHAVGSGLNPQ